MDATMRWLPSRNVVVLPVEKSERSNTVLLIGATVSTGVNGPHRSAAVSADLCVAKRSLKHARDARAPCSVSA